MLTRTEIVAEIRRAVGESQIEFARKHKVSEFELSRALNGRKPPSAKLLKIVGYRMERREPVYVPE